MAIPRIGFIPSAITAVNKADENGLFASVRSVNLTKVNPDDKSKLTDAPQAITLKAGEAFVTVKTAEGVKLGIVDSRALSSARRTAPAVEFPVEIVSDHLSEAAIATLHSVDGLDSEVAISE